MSFQEKAPQDKQPHPELHIIPSSNSNLTNNKTIDLSEDNNTNNNTNNNNEKEKPKNDEQKQTILKIPSQSFTDSLISPTKSEQFQQKYKKRPSLLIQNTRRFSLQPPSLFKPIQSLSNNFMNSTEPSITNLNTPKNAQNQHNFNIQIHETNSSDSSDSTEKENSQKNSKKSNDEQGENLETQKKSSKKKLKKQKVMENQISLQMGPRYIPNDQQKIEPKSEGHEQDLIHNKVDFKGIIGTLIDEMNPILIVILSSWSFMIQLASSETISNSHRMNRPDLQCRFNQDNECQQMVSVTSYFDCVENYYLLNMSIFINQNLVCGPNGLEDTKDSEAIDQIWWNYGEVNDGANALQVSKITFITHSVMFITLIIIAVIIYIRKYGKYGTGSYVLFSLRLEYISWYRNWIKITTLIFILTILTAGIYYILTIQSNSIIFPVSQFSVLLVIQFRYMLLKRRLWLDLENPEFQNAVFNRKGAIEYIMSNNFIYFNALERAAKEDLKNQNHDQMNQMIVKGNVQAIQNLLLNRDIHETYSSPDYFTIFDENKLPEKPQYHKCICWKSIIFIITNEFRELITIFSQLLMSTISLTQTAYILGNDDNLGCELSQRTGECHTKLEAQEYYKCITSYLNDYYIANLFSHRDAYCKRGELIYEIPDDKDISQYYIVNIEYTFLIIKILLWLILSGTIYLMIHLVYQYIKEKSGKFNTGQFLTFCLQIDQTYQFKFLAKCLFFLYFFANLLILITLIVYQGGQGIQSCIFSTFSVLSEFRVLIYNQKITQNIEDPAFQQAEFRRGGLGWFIWIYSDKYFNYLELAAMDDLNHQKQLIEEDDEQFKTLGRKISRQTSNLSRPMKQLDQTKIQSMSESGREQIQYYPNLSQYIIKGDIQRIAQILLYRR